MAPIVYKTEGQKIAKQLYEETLDEFEFAGVKEIIAEFAKLKWFVLILIPLEDDWTNYLVSCQHNRYSLNSYF